ncbi:hypothetical protein COCNU_12G001730 [Cocos nucifera]|uniref:RNase H type-1 domain-containing protein n=1 Tax=Cocos nucifera TaxID=13894 RepID=A0A8K0IRH5_COCNU|nr:hypothetical protein COCNU_12G001730 [Cocos nucifera]
MIWNSRNDFIFNQKEHSATHIHLSALRYAHEYLQAGHISSLADGLQRWGADGSMSPSLGPSLGYPLPCDRVKVNFDASWSDGKVGLGCFIRDHHGTVVYAEAIRTVAHSVPETEVLVAWSAITTATYRLKFTQIWLEGDSSTIINWIIKHLRCFMQINSSRSYSLCYLLGFISDLTCLPRGQSTG